MLGADEDSVESVHVVVRLCQVASERVEGHLRRLREECWYRAGYEVSIPHGTFQLPLGQLDGGDVVPVLYVLNFISVLNICLNIYCDTIPFLFNLPL